MAARRSAVVSIGPLRLQPPVEEPCHWNSVAYALRSALKPHGKQRSNGTESDHWPALASVPSAACLPSQEHQKPRRQWCRQFSDGRPTAFTRPLAANAQCRCPNPRAAIRHKHRSPVSPVQTDGRYVKRIEGSLQVLATSHSSLCTPFQGQASPSGCPRYPSRHPLNGKATATSHMSQMPLSLSLPRSSPPPAKSTPARLGGSNGGLSI
jgi:hypothetical protein